MNCPSCNTLLEHNARFCGVCGYRLQAKASPVPSGVGGGRPGGPNAGFAAAAPARPSTPAAGAPKHPPRPQKPRATGDAIYINQVLNNRFKVESKIGEGGFGAVYRGVQLATGRKVALKLLHPEMTKDENLVARFRREGMVLCNLRDAHTITTYDFDQTPDGTLYIAMELLEGRSLHQVFHEQRPLEWKRMFKILGEMCSSLAEAHAQGIVHRDLKPENVYLETRPGNPEFVKILDFGIAKVMRGDTIDPQAPQLTATGQTLGTLEYMSPEQLMGKPLDGRSDVYALGVVAYEMITARLPFPDAKGPAGLITAQLKQTPVPPSQANPKISIPDAANRVILKCLEKDKNNRYADVTKLANALAEVVTQASAEHERASHDPAFSFSAPVNRSDLAGSSTRLAPPEGDPRHSNPAMGQRSSPPQPGGMQPPSLAPIGAPRAQSYPQAANGMQGSGIANPQHPSYPQVAPPQRQLAPRAQAGSIKWIWWVVGLLALGAVAGAVLAFALR
ncbi:MAG: serine/threonine protein kinase [Deltaproteobacteria bacterium]|nr:serine/threonine protein kinase [Deltaproteobacteria bacterium]